MNKGEGGELFNGEKKRKGEGTDLMSNPEIKYLGEDGWKTEYELTQEIRVEFRPVERRDQSMVRKKQSRWG